MSSPAHNGMARAARRSIRPPVSTLLPHSSARKREHDSTRKLLLKGNIPYDSRTSRRIQPNFVDNLRLFVPHKDKFILMSVCLNNDSISRT